MEPLKCSPGLVEYSFDNHAENFSQEIRNFFWSKSENSYEFLFFSTKNSSKCSLGHVDCSFDNLALMFFLKVLFAQSQVCIFLINYFSSKCSSGHVESTFENCYRKFFVQSPNMITKFFFQKHCFLSKIIPGSNSIKKTPSFF